LRNVCVTIVVAEVINRLTPNDTYSGRTATLTSKRCILYIYSTNTGTEYFKHGIYCPFFPRQNAVSFIILTYLVPILFTFYIQGVLKLKKNNSGAKRLSITYSEGVCVAFGIQPAMHVLHVVICGLSRCTMFSILSHKRHDFGKTKFIDHKMCFSFHYKLCLKYFLRGTDM